MSTTAIVIIVVLAILVLAIAGALAWRAQERRRLRERFGPEYDRAIATTGGKKEAEADLRGRVDRRDHLSIRPLAADQRAQYDREWRRVQAEFVDAPARSLDRADSLVIDVMVDRGYPMQDFDQQADLISVDHPEIVENYRTAHSVHGMAHDGEASTEDIRRAFMAHRQLFDDLLQDGSDSSDSSDSSDGALSRRRANFRT